MKNIVDKRKPTHDLKQMKILLDEENYRFTFTARKSYTSMELTEGEAVDIIKSLQQSDFEKSMTTKHDNRIWQDVYKPNTDEYGSLYIKLQIDTETKLVIISFKSNELG